MSIEIIEPSSYVIGGGFLPSNTTGLVGAFVFGDTALDSLKNHAGGPDLSVTGTPTMATGYARCSSSGYFQSSVAETQDMTIITVSRYPGTYSTQAFVVGNFDSPVDGTFMYYQASNNFRFGARESLGVNPVNSGAYDISKWKFFVGRCQGASSVLASLRRYDPGPAQDNNTVVATRQLNGKTMRIGHGTYQATGGANVDIHMVLIYNRYLTDAECDVIRVEVSAMVADRGITLG